MPSKIQISNLNIKIVQEYEISLSCKNNLSWLKWNIWTVFTPKYRFKAEIFNGATDWILGISSSLSTLQSHLTHLLKDLCSSLSLGTLGHHHCYRDKCARWGLGRNFVMLILKAGELFEDAFLRFTSQFGCRCCVLLYYYYEVQGQPWTQASLTVLSSYLSS